ncbi:MAG: zinc ribbon domain-containing protein [bacterium]|nr:zinc ribbon domain-containing protein [bacterium]
MKILSRKIMAWSMPGLILVVCFMLGSILYAQEEGRGPGAIGINRAREVTGEKVKCPQCGTLNDPTNNNCVSCGYALKSGGSSTPPPSVSVDEYRRFQAAAPQVVPDGSTPGNQPQVKEEKRYTVVEGVHESCVKCNKELRKPKKREIFESQLAGFYDDGAHGDEVAGDGIYSNITEEKDRLCDECWDQFQSLQRLVKYSQQDSPVEFYMVSVAAEDPSTTPPSPIPTQGYWASRRDGRDGFFADYTTRIFASYKDPITKEFYKQFQWTVEELAAIKAEKKRQTLEQRWQQQQNHQQEPTRDTPMYGEVQPEQYRSSYFGEQHSGPHTGPE